MTLYATADKLGFSHKTYLIFTCIYVHYDIGIKQLKFFHLSCNVVVIMNYQISNRSDFFTVTYIHPTLKEKAALS